MKERETETDRQMGCVGQKATFRSWFSSSVGSGDKTPYHQVHTR